MKDYKRINNEEKKYFRYKFLIFILSVTFILYFESDKLLSFIIFYLIIIVSIIKRDKQDEERENTNNFIIGEILIGPNDINKDIQIINSFENIKSINNYENDLDDSKNENVKEIKEKIKIKINGKIIKFQYLYNFEKEGKYRIEYYFKTNLTNANHLFCNCNNLINLDLSNFNTKNITICILCLVIANY